jgi:hypothetical protein
MITCNTRYYLELEINRVPRLFPLRSSLERRGKSLGTRLMYIIIIKYFFVHEFVELSPKYLSEQGNIHTALAVESRSRDCDIGFRNLYHAYDYICQTPS